MSVAYWCNILKCYLTALLFQLVDLDKELNIDVHIKVRQNLAFKTESDPHEIIFVGGQSADDDGFYNRLSDL